MALDYGRYQEGGSLMTFQNFGWSLPPEGKHPGPLLYLLNGV